MCEGDVTIMKAKSKIIRRKRWNISKLGAL
jgi:hypothetical protein